MFMTVRVLDARRCFQRPLFTFKFQRVAKRQLSPPKPWRDVPSNIFGAEPFSCKAPTTPTTMPAHLRRPTLSHRRRQAPIFMVRGLTSPPVAGDMRSAPMMGSPTGHLPPSCLNLHRTSVSRTLTDMSSFSQVALSLLSQSFQVIVVLPESYCAVHASSPASHHHHCQTSSSSCSPTCPQKEASYSA